MLTTLKAQLSAILFLCSTYIYCMEITQPNNSTTPPTLKKLCLAKLQSTLNETQNCNTLSKLNISALSQLPEDVCQKLIPYVFIKSALITPCHVSLVGINDTNNMVVLRNHIKGLITFLDLSTKESSHLPLKSGAVYSSSNDGALILIPNGANETTTIITNYGEQSTTAPYYLDRSPLLKNTNEIILFEDTFDAQIDFIKRTYSLFNSKTNTLLYEDSDLIQTDGTNTFFLVKKNNRAILYKKIDSTNHEPIRIFEDARDTSFTFNPNGKQLCILNKRKNVHQLLSLTEEKTTDLNNSIVSICFNTTGTLGLIRKNNGLLSIIDTFSGFSLQNMQIPENYYGLCLQSIHFNNNLLTVKLYNHDNNYNTDVYIVNVKQLLKSNNDNEIILDLNDLVAEKIATLFHSDTASTCSLHPNEQYIATINNGTWNLTHITSQQIVASLNNVSSFRFSPAGTMLFVSYKNKPSEIFFLRNDFTPAEHVLHCLLQGKKIIEADIAENEDLQYLYESMQKEGKLEFQLARQ